MFESSKLTHFYSHHPSKFCPFGLCFLFRRLFGRLPRVVLRLSWDCGWYLRLCAPVESDKRIYSVLKLLHQHMSVKSLRKALLLYGGINFWERGKNSAKASAYVWLCLRGWKGVFLRPTQNRHRKDISVGELLQPHVNRVDFVFGRTHAALSCETEESFPSEAIHLAS